MSDIGASVSGGLPTFAQGGSVPLLVSPPENVHFYWVQLHELEKLMTVERPFSLAIASATTGFFLGLLPMLQEEAAAFSNPGKMTPTAMIWSVIYFALAALFVGISIVTWVDAFRGKSDARQVLADIKKRPAHPA